MTDKDYLRSLRRPTEDDPLRILVSACLVGTLCGADGSSYGSYPHIVDLLNHAAIRPVPFCPEHFAFGTPRAIPDIEGGDGNDVLDGKAKVVTEQGEDITEGMVTAAERMLALAKEHDVELAVMMDVSGACGSQVIYKGHRLSEQPSYQIGMGVCAALLHRNGIKIISQRDFRSLEIVKSRVFPDYEIDSNAIDHDETDWYREYFNV